MNEIANTQQAGLTPIAVLAEEARIYSESMAMNMLNLGRVFTEAKKQVAHGEWGDWVQRYSGMSVRSAQQLMAIYSRFGDKPAFAGVEKSKMYKMLALPEGTEEAFAEKNDLSAMTSREVEEAVKRVREQANEEIRRERAARKAAEERAEELSARPPEVPEEVSAALKSKDAMIEQQKQELERIAATGRDSVAEANRLRSDNNRLRRELNENAELLEETQQECNRAQAELLNLQSTVARIMATASLRASCKSSKTTMPQAPRPIFLPAAPHGKRSCPTAPTTAIRWSRPVRRARCIGRGPTARLRWTQLPRPSTTSIAAPVSRIWSPTAPICRIFRTSSANWACSRPPAAP